MLVHLRSTRAVLVLILLLVAGRPALAVVAADSAVSRTAVTSARPLSRLRASPMLVALIARMADRSPSFARQCARLEQTRTLFLRMRLDAPVRHGRYVARSVIQRHEFGAIVVDVTLHTPPDLVETIAHELEHVLEQVERLDLYRLSTLKGSGVVRTWNGDYETERAVAAGRRVAAEFFDGPGDASTTAAAY